MACKGRRGEILQDINSVTLVTISFVEEFADLINVNQLCLIYFGDVHMMFGCDDEASLEPQNY